jgi:ATP-binding protein involved in chromosome partitioning
MSASTDEIKNNLKKIKVAGLNRDLVSTKMLENIDITGNELTINLNLPTPSPIIKQQLEDEIRKSLLNYKFSSIQFKINNTIPYGKGSEGKQAVPGIRNIIAVSSGKGGVGKSTVAVNLAVQLAQWGARVGLLDTDVYGPNVPIMMGIAEEPQVQGQKLLPLEQYGVKVMSIGFLNPGDRPVVWRGPMLHTAVRQFLYDVLWGELDYLIVDMPPGTGDAQLSLAQLVPVQGAVLVTTPQEVAMADVRKALNMFEQVHIPVLGIVENMSYFVCSNCSQSHYIFGSGGGEALAQRFQTRLLGKIPLSTDVREGGDQGIPIVIRDPQGQQAQAIAEISGNVTIEIAKQAMVSTGLPIINLGDNRGDSFAV